MFNHIPYSFTEMPLDTTGNFFGISKVEFDNQRLENGEQLEPDHRYRYLLTNKLTVHSISDLEDFIEFQLDKIQDKLTWLRNLDIMVNKNIVPFFGESQCKTKLETLIPEIIQKYKTPFKETPSTQGNTTFLALDNSMVIKTKFTIDELILLFEILNFSDLIETEGITKVKMSEFIATHFTSINKTDGFKPSSVVEMMKRKNDKAFRDLDDKLSALIKRLRQKNNAI